VPATTEQALLFEGETQLRTDM